MALSASFVGAAGALPGVASTAALAADVRGIHLLWGPIGLLIPGLLGLAARGDPGDALDRLTRQVERLAEGDYDVEVETDRDDEVAGLAEAVDDLASKLRDREGARGESERYREQLYEVAAETGVEDDEKIQRLLELGRDRLGVEAGFISRIDEDTGRYDVRHATGSHLVEVGDETDLSEMYCARTIQAEGALAIYDAAAEGWEDHPSNEELGVSCYMGAKILVHDDLYGTLCFVSEAPRESPFSNDEKAFVDLMARWISHVYERRERELEREESERYRRKLYEITSDPSFDDEAKIRRLLELGRERFGVENGVVTRINLETGDYLVETAVGTEFVEEGSVSDLLETFCRRTITSDDVLGIYNATEEGFADDPAYAEWGISCYLGGKIQVGDELYGTICFVDDDAHEAPFTHEEKTFVDLMARWVSHVYERRRRERDLRRSERQFEAVFNDPKMLVALLDPDGTLRQVNRVAFRYVDVDREAVVGEPFPETPWWADTPASAVREWIDRAAAGDYVEYETHLDVADRGRHWVSGTFRPVLDDAGDVVSIVVSARDVTGREERERALQRYKEYTDDVLDAVDDVFYVLDEAGELRRWNESLVEATGYGHDEIEEMHALEFFDEAHREPIADAIETVFETGHARVEAPFLTTDGEQVPYEFVASRLEDPDGETVLAGIGRDVTERVAYEREIERTRSLLEQSQRLATVGAWEVRVEDGEAADLVATDEVNRIHGLPADADLPLEKAFGFYHPEDEDRIRAGVDRAVRDGVGYDFEARLITEDEDERWVRTIADPVHEDGDVVAVRGSIQDITEHKERELALESLHEATRGLLGTETEEGVAELIVETARDVLGVPGVGVYLLDTESNRLEPAAFSPEFVDLRGETPAAATHDSVLWTAYVAGTKETLDEAAGFGPAVEDGLVVPVGDHGVFVVAARSAVVDDDVRRLVETLVATTEAALDRLESEASLRERDAELEARNRRLRRQIQITDIIRRIDQTLIGAASREEIEAAVCERLVEAEDVAFAWIGSYDAAGSELVPRAWAGSAWGYLDEISLANSEPPSEPAVTTARRETPVVVPNVVEDLKAEGWRKRALAHGLNSVVSVPLALDDYFYGVLTVYGDAPETFGELERTVFAELGENIANSINSVKARAALHGEAGVELTLRFDEPDTFLARLAREADASVSFEGLATRSDDEARLFFAVDGDAAAVDDVLADLVSVADHRLVSESDGRALFEATVTGDVLAARLVRLGASPRSIRASAGGVEAVVEVPPETDVREFVETLEGRYDAVELVGRRDVQRDAPGGRRPLELLLETLTERQAEVLRTAYYAGFFEWPRESTGQDVAEMLDVSQPTVNRHLRRAQQRLLEQLFDGPEAVTET